MPLLNWSGSPDSLQVNWRFDAPGREVFRHLTDPIALPTWLGRPVTATFEVGGLVVIDHGDGYLCDSEVTAIDDGSLLALTWKFPDEPQTAVNCALTPTDTGCVLELTHSGLGDLLDSYAKGWPVHLTYLEAAVHGDPLPTSQFWNLHATMSQQAAAADNYPSLHNAIRTFSAERDWSRFHDPKSLLLAMVGEVGELAELVQWLPAAESTELVAQQPLHGQVADEISDVLIYLLQLADACGVDLIPAATRKLAAVARKYPVEQYRSNAPERPR